MQAEAGEDKTPDVGSLLSGARKSRGLNDLDNVARELCIRPHLLEALEQNNFSAFPTACYASGFLKSYATYLGLDATSVVSQFKSEYEGAFQKVELVFPEVPARASLPRNIAASIGGLSLVMVLGVGMMFGTEEVREDLIALDDVSSLSMADTMLTASAPATATQIALAEPVKQAVEKVAAEPGKKPVEKKLAENKPVDESPTFTLVQQATAHTNDSDADEIFSREVRATPVVGDRIRLTAAADIWVRISGPEGEILFDRVVQEGEEFFAPDRKGLKLMTSNASALSLFVGDVAISPLGDYGQIVSELTLDQQHLLQKTALLQH